MKRTGWVAAAACSVVMALGGTPLVGANSRDDDDQRHARHCSDATIRGDYGIQIQGTRPAPGGLTESVIGVVLRTYDGQGNFSQVSNVKGSITGTVPDAQGFGMYNVNADCTGMIVFQPAPGVVIEERLVIVDNGREIRTATMSPAALMITGVHQRTHTR